MDLPCPCYYGTVGFTPSKQKMVRFHYGHPDVFDRLFHLTRGGVSKASKVINLSEDIFAGFNSTLREGNVTHHEYIQVGKGRDVGLNQISMFEAKIANGNGEQTLSRDIYRLGHRFDFFRMLSCYFTTVTVLTVYVFLYGRLYLVLSGLEQGLREEPAIRDNKPLQVALASQSFVQIGFLMALPMLMEIGLERGFQTALSEFILMQLQLAPVFFTFSLGTKTHYYGRTLLHGGAKYRPTGRGFVVFHAKFAENYRLYSRSHFVKGIEMMILLIVYQICGHTYRSTVAYVLISASLWFMVGTWLFAPFLFNPSGFEWQKIVDDWTDWNKWINNRGGIGVPSEKSWESWWEEEQEHLQYSGKRGIIAELLLALRFFIYQYGLVYHLHVTRGTKSFLVYGASWLVIVLILFLMKIAQALRPVVKKAGFWGSVRTLARGYEIVMGLLLFTPVAFLAWFPFVSEFQTRMLFNQAFSRGLQISRILGGHRKDRASRHKEEQLNAITVRDKEGLVKLEPELRQEIVASKGKGEETRSRSIHEPCSSNNKGPIYEELRLQIEELDEWRAQKLRTHDKPKPRHDRLNVSPNQLKVGDKVLLDAADPRITTSEPNGAIPFTVLNIFPYDTVEVTHFKFGSFKSKIFPQHGIRYVATTMRHGCGQSCQINTGVRYANVYKHGRAHISTGVGEANEAGHGRANRPCTPTCPKNTGDL
ncbi:hypothetical protein GOBAR_AA15028 [Gossypium barbadense]|uniref:Glycosyl transferase 48 domain-containing protein n=1 Tax=Gossypium barbadense TaxID=3634 RepID=A0A2P5XQK5_GOSBA|nr:hypothetical protein GOBAR_AA15028 [Gossypium barbadense]